MAQIGTPHHVDMDTVESTSSSSRARVVEVVVVLEEEDFDIFVLEIEDEIILAASLAAFAASLRLLRVRFGMLVSANVFASILAQFFFHFK